MVVVLVVIAAVLAAVAVGAIVAAVRARRRLAEAAQIAEAARVVAECTRAELTAAVEAETEAADASALAAGQAQRELADVRRQIVAFDPQVLWSLEQLRMERTWRFSVAPSPEVPSGLAEAQHPLVAALQIEVEAVREEVGTIVVLDAHIDGEISPAAAVLTLRVAQELLAGVVRSAEETTLQVRLAKADTVVIGVEAIDEYGERVPLVPLDLPTSAGVEQTVDGAVVHGGR